MAAQGVCRVPSAPTVLSRSFRRCAVTAVRDRPVHRLTAVVFRLRFDSSGRYETAGPYTGRSRIGFDGQNVKTIAIASVSRTDNVFYVCYEYLTYELTPAGIAGSSRKSESTRLRVIVSA